MIFIGIFTKKEIVHVLAACVLWNTLYLGEIRNCNAPGKIDQSALFFSDSTRIIMPNGDNIGVKSILVISPIFVTPQSGALCISVTHFLGRQDFFGS